MTAARDLPAEPFELRCVAVLAHRPAKPALSGQLGDRRNVPTRELAELYRTWARGGAGLLVTGNEMVDPAALGEPRNVALPAVPDPTARRPWARSVDGRRAAVGPAQPPRPAESAVPLTPTRAPSAVAFGNRAVRTAFAPPRAPTGDEIEAIVDRFALAARTFVEAGFAGVQLHGAHGYLISQFLSPLTNRRAGEWDRDRSRFLLELVRRVRAALGDSVPVSVKLNSADFQRSGFAEDESLRVVHALSDSGDRPALYFRRHV
ncbi:hypothetical protein [Amycolatopsis sp. FDAARGOS 1241]|uniref:oxidoreductase n=1 Tax=Amycolatopsis sp. FDAARGOS 1241 TaxID=2778070 RepID=UPI0019508918|nr:hypothetical protein [Amycolatopsis sp. FDAARGOS 1241]QRP47198.1 hypothetical protein I6J71_04095 [Amycolatopsis sp. FDAARGOS 1241]